MTPASLPRRLRQHAASYLLLALVATLSPLPTSAQGNSKASQYYEDALTRYEKKDLKGAIIQLKNALQIDPTMLPVQLLLGKALMQNGEVIAAEVAFNEALKLGVNRAEVVVQLGEAMVAQGKHRDVLAQSTFATAGLPAGVQQQMHLLRAAIHTDLGDSSAAMKAIEEARAIDRRNVNTWLAEVPVRIRARQLKEAATAAEAALALQPDSAEAWYQKGTVAHVRGGLRDAVAAYDRALQLDPAHVESRIARTGVALDQGRFDDARKDAAELLKHAPREPRGAYMRALLAERDGDAGAARTALKEVTDLLDPVPLNFIRFRPQLLMLNGVAHFSLNEGEKAKQYLEAFQIVYAGSPVSKLLAQIYLGDGNTAQAITVLETYLRTQPRDGQALTLLARAHMAGGRNAKASALMQEALKTRDDPAFRTALGLSLVGSGQTAGGIAELESVYKKNPRELQAAVALVQIYLQNNLGKKAVPVAEQLVKAQANNAVFHNLLGMAYGQAGNLAASRKALERSVALDASLRAAKLNLARLDIATKAHDAAVERLNALLQADPKYSEAMYEMAVVANQKGQPAEAQRWLEKAREAGARDEVRWDLALVDFHLRRGQAGPALDAAKSASSKKPDNVRVQMAYARAATAGGDTVAAKTALNSATRFADYDAPTQVEIATLQMAANNAAGASYSLEKALSSQPDFLPAQALMTDVELRQGEVAKAEKRARDIVAQHPKLAIGHSLLGDVAMARNQLPAAIDGYRRAHELQPGTDSLLRLFRAQALQDPQPAVRLAEQWLKKYPRDLPVHKALADGHARAGSFQTAKAAYEAALGIQPGDPELLNNLANVQLQLKDPGAVKTAERALAQAPGNALVTDTLGWALFQNGQTERALQLLRDARLRRPDNPDIRYHLAVVLAKTGRTVEAREELTSALKLGPANFESANQARALLGSLR